MIPAGSYGLVGEIGPELVKGPAVVTGRKQTAGKLGNNGSAPITLTTDLKRGAYGTYAGPMSGPARPVSAGSTSMAPIPNP